MQVTSDYLTKNNDFREFLNKCSDNTGAVSMGLWVKNLRENRVLFRKCGWAIEKLQDKERGKAAIIMGASPAIHKQLDTLRKLQDDNDFVLCGISSNLEYLLNNGIRPKYIMTADADISQGEFFENIDMDKVKDITLIANLFAYPPMLKKWKGPLRFLGLGTSDQKNLGRKQKKWYSPINGNGMEFPSIVAQYNIMAIFAFLVLGCQVLLFVGHELSFQEKESKYYVDRDDPRDKEARFPHGDIYGNIVHTSPKLLAVKYSLEGFLEIIAGAGWFINCTEAGIFGISKRFPDLHLPWIQQLTLENGIAQARRIMKDGEPFYVPDETSSIIVPNMRSRVSLRK